MAVARSGRVATRTNRAVLIDAVLTCAETNSCCWVGIGVEGSLLGFPLMIIAGAVERWSTSSGADVFAQDKHLDAQQPLTGSRGHDEDMDSGRRGFGGFGLEDFGGMAPGKQGRVGEWEGGETREDVEQT